MTDDTTAASSNAASGCKLKRKIIGNLRGRFFVPSYQRGYRWSNEDVLRLLDDIWESDGSQYSLQPVVVKLHIECDDESQREWELIDGQQRLTTLYLILEYIKREIQCGKGSPYRIGYDTRNKSEEYLNSLDPELKDTNIDFYHLYHADRAIHGWFQQWGDEYAQFDIASDIRSYLFKSVGIIWYEAPPETSATELFTRLNVGRIPLTDAELVKAALLTKIPEKASKDEVESTVRAQEISAQWDGIERDLHQPDIWAFVAGITADANDERYPTRISLLLDTLADSSEELDKFTGKRPRYYTFDQLRKQIKENPTVFWEKVIALHAQILGWFAQPRIYNKIGYLVAAGKSFGEIVDEAKGMKKSAFDAYLIDLIRGKIKTSEHDLGELSYESKPGPLQLLLLLMNVETVSKAGQRFSFAKHIEKRWSLEHIHAQNAESLNKAEQWASWLDNHREALQSVKSDINAGEIDTLSAEVDTAITKINDGGAISFSKQSFQDLSGRMIKFLGNDDSDDHSIHSISNLALLSSEQNSGLSNSVFEVKRRKILDWDYSGEYIPVCTRNIFLKYYGGADAIQPYFWSTRDKDAYTAAIHEILSPYLNTAPEVNHEYSS